MLLLNIKSILIIQMRGKPSEPFTHENIDDDYKIHQRIVSDIVNMDANPAPVHLTDIFGVYSRQNIFKGRGLKKDARLNSVLQLRPDYTYIFIEDRVSYDLAKKDHKVVQFVVKGKFTINKKLVNSEIEQIIDFEKGEIFVEHTTGYIISLRPTSPNASGGGVFIGSLGLVSSGELFYDLTNPRGTPRTGFTGYTAKKFIKTK